MKTKRNKNRKCKNRKSLKYKGGFVEYINPWDARFFLYQLFNYLRGVNTLDMQNQRINDTQTVNIKGYDITLPKNVNPKNVKLTEVLLDHLKDSYVDGKLKKGTSLQFFTTDGKRVTISNDNSSLNGPKMWFG